MLYKESDFKIFSIKYNRWPLQGANIYNNVTMREIVYLVEITYTSQATKVSIRMWKIRRIFSTG